MTRVFCFTLAISRYDLTYFERRVIAPLLPNNPRGGPRVDDRRVLNGIFPAPRSGAPWRGLPECYGSRATWSGYILIRFVSSAGEEVGALLGSELDKEFANRGPEPLVPGLNILALSFGRFPFRSIRLRA